MTGNQWASLTSIERNQLHYVLHTQGLRYPKAAVALISEDKIIRALLTGGLGGLDRNWGINLIVKLVLNR